MAGVRSNTTRACTSTIVTTAGTVLDRNDARADGLIQNLGTNPLFVKLGASASASDFTTVLPGGSAADDGFGGSFPLGNYVGIVSIAGTTPRCVVSEFIA
jgi:hypothetical protein